MSAACRDALLKVARERGTHAGLLLARFLRIPVKTEEKHPEDRLKLHKSAQVACQAAREIYTPAFNRRRDFLKNSAELLLSVEGRLAIGLGEANVLETGITLHFTYGTPILPGTALKGLAAHYCDQVWGRKNDEFKKEIKFNEGEHEKKRPGLYYGELFGTSDDSGHIIFHDAWITPESLASTNQGLLLDVMTPHHRDYYMPEDKNNPPAPTDFDSPNPIGFLSIRGTFHVAVSCDISGENGKKWEYLALNLLSQSLGYWGIGGKTNAGYGRMVDPALVSVQPLSSIEGGPRTEVPSGPRFKAGEQVTVKRVEDPKGRDRVWFQADDGFGGVVTRGAVPQVQVGDTASLWVAAVSKDTYNFSTEAPRSPKRNQTRGRR